MNEDKLNYDTLARVQSQALPVWFSCPGGSSHQDCLLRDPYEMNDKGKKKDVTSWDKTATSSRVQAEWLACRVRVEMQLAWLR